MGGKAVLLLGLSGRRLSKGRGMRRYPPRSSLTLGGWMKVVCFAQALRGTTVMLVGANTSLDGQVPAVKRDARDTKYGTLHAGSGLGQDYMHNEMVRP